MCLFQWEQHWPMVEGRKMSMVFFFRVKLVWINRPSSQAVSGFVQRRKQSRGIEDSGALLCYSYEQRGKANILTIPSPLFYVPRMSWTSSSKNCHLFVKYWDTLCGWHKPLIRCLWRQDSAMFFGSHIPCNSGVNNIISTCTSALELTFQRWQLSCWVFHF